MARSFENMASAPSNTETSNVGACGPYRHRPRGQLSCPGAVTRLRVGARVCTRLPHRAPLACPQIKQVDIRAVMLRFAALGSHIARQNALPQPDAPGRHFHELVVVDEFNRCSRLSTRGGMSRIASSAVEARMLVCFFSLVTLTSMSLTRAFSPMIIPS